jgi:competence protein ComEC
MRWLPAPLAARGCGVLAAAGYALLAGWGVPAQRTVLMLALVALLRSAGLRWPSLLVLLAAAAGVAVFDPWALLQPGFWLSFAAVALLMLSDAEAAGPAVDRRGPQRLLRAARAGLRTQAIASLGLAPLTIVFFQQVAVVGFVANLVAIPLVTLLITPLALLGVLLPPLWTAAAWAVAALDRLLGALAALPWATFGAPAAPAWAVGLGLVGLAVLLLPLPWRLRGLGAPMLLPLLAPAPLPPAAGAVEVIVADVGQGSAVLVRTRRHLLVYDAGPRYAPEVDAGQRVLLPLLRARGEARIDRLVLSHRDVDHVGGAAALLAGVEVASIASSLEPGHPLRRAGVPHEPCAAGGRWQWDGVDFEWLHPLPGASGASPNALSCVLRVQAADGRSLLLAGDIEAAQEAALVARAGARLRAQVLVVPHHGSRTSSSEAFVQAVAPGTAVVQAGYRNRFGHPAPAVEARYAALGVELLRSDHCGAWTWTAEGSTRCEREAGARYWHHRPQAAGSRNP